MCKQQFSPVKETYVLITNFKDVVDSPLNIVIGTIWFP